MLSSHERLLFCIFILFSELLSFQKLGFASCRRAKGATEGINVLLEKKNLDDQWSYGISCIEYTEFDKFGIVEGPLSSKRYFGDLHFHKCAMIPLQSLGY